MPRSLTFTMTALRSQRVMVWSLSIDCRPLCRWDGSVDLRQECSLSPDAPSFSLVLNFSCKFAILRLNLCTRSFDLQVVRLNWMLGRTAQDDDTQVMVLWLKVCKESPNQAPCRVRGVLGQSRVSCIWPLKYRSVKANLYPTSFHQQIHRPP
jgi:hypothetical protein